MNKCHYIIIFGLMIFSCSLPTYGQREVYIFEPDYDIQYCAHKLLYDNFKNSRKYPVAYEGFFSKNALKNKYTHCRIDKKISEGKIAEEALITFNKAGFIKRIRKTFDGRQYDELYTYTDDNKTIIRSNYYRDSTSKLKLSYYTTFYFNDQLLIDSIVNKYHKITFLYDSSSRVTQITSYKIREKGTEQDDIIYELYERRYGRLLPDEYLTYSNAMQEDAPETLLFKYLEGREYHLLDIDIKEGEAHGRLSLKQRDEVVYMEKIIQRSHSPFFSEEFESFYQWDSLGTLIKYSNYHILFGNGESEVFKRKDGVLKVSFMKSKSKDNGFNEFTDFKIEEPIEFKIERNRIELPNKIITYYKL